jgi:acyl-CoA synthetase (AMP-forming)/AMP-acid ligase II
METLQTFALYKVQGLIASPGGLSGFLTIYDTNRDFPCSFDIILTAGSPLPDQLSQQVRSRMCSNLIFYYGTTETSTIASAPAHALTGLAGAVGYVTPDVSVQIIDEHGDGVPANREGSVRVRTPVSVKGYLDDPQQAGPAFRDGYFDTGDIGYLTDENMLVISGRKKEVFNLGGDKISPRIIEDALRAFYGIRDAAVLSVANGHGIDEVWAVIVPHGRLNEEALQKHCRERLAQTHVPVRFINVADIPRNANGKVDRSRLNAMVEGFAAKV